MHTRLAHTFAVPGCTGQNADYVTPQLTEDALAFVQAFMDCGVPKIAIENPIGCISSRIRKPDQIIQPWMFGHGETKATCLWLYGLPKLKPTKIVEGRENRIWKMPPSKDRWKERSRTYQGIADAMADQWGNETFTLEYT